MFSDDTKIVLVNAIYFKGIWKEEFDPEETTKGPFTTQEGTVQVEFMIKESEYRYRSHEGFDSVQLPYVGDKFSMKDLSELEAMVTQSVESAAAFLDSTSMAKQTINLQVPKFKIESSIPLQKIMSSQGVTALFDDEKADLTGFTKDKPLFVSDTLHKAVLEVNEKGSEGAAASAAIITSLRSSWEPMRLRFDKPFLFFIKYEPSATIVFQGKVANPSL